ncbi:MAG: hypothetical protein DLM58_10745 [Pseudonocardiales bacterium]|nr:MAG: hypothetical protein DLM58_10745 [Pseudonocardiales bacterium]
MGDNSPTHGAAVVAEVTVIDSIVDLLGPVMVVACATCAASTPVATPEVAPALLVPTAPPSMSTVSTVAPASLRRRPGECGVWGRMDMIGTSDWRQVPAK